MSGTLSLHCDASPVTEDEVAAQPTPEPTATWSPISHYDYASAVVGAVKSAGYEVGAVKYGLSRPEDKAGFGMARHRMFGIVELVDDLVGGQARTCVGFKNSTDQTLSAGLAIGSKVFVCNNRAFSAERVLHRRHTSGFMHSLPYMMETAVQVLGMAARTQKEFYERLDAFTLQGEDSLVDSALVQAVEKGVMPWTKIPHAKKAFYHPQHEQFDKPSAWSLFNAVTEITKKYSTDTMAERTIGFSDLFHDIFTPDLKKVSIN